MKPLVLAHTQGGYLREFAYKTVNGIDIPYKDGHLPDLRRLRYKPIKNDHMMESLTKRYNNRPGEYVSVYSFEKTDDDGKIDYTTAKINRIYLDFDCEENPQSAISEALITARVLNKYKIFTHCYFSGGKGIAMYVDFNTVDIRPENKKETIAFFFDMVKESVEKEYENWFGMWIKTTQGGEWGLQTLDRQVRGDISRVSRIPNSRHKSGLFCIPLSFGDMRKGITYIKETAKTPHVIDLEDIIIYNKMRNESAPIIIKNIEKQIIENRRGDEEYRELKQREKELQKTKRPDKKEQITEEDIQKAKSVPLSQVISSENRMRCPIHKGDNPTSFYIDHKKNYWYCHSCGRGGDAISYLMENDKLSFVDAVKKLI